MQSEHSKTKIKQCTFLCYNSILHGLTVKGTHHTNTPTPQ